MIPAEGLEQLWHHGGQFLQTGHSVLWWWRTSCWLSSLHGLRVKAQSFEHFKTGTWQKKMTSGVSGIAKTVLVLFYLHKFIHDTIYCCFKLHWHTLGKLVFSPHFLLLETFLMNSYAVKQINSFWCVRSATLLIYSSNNAQLFVQYLQYNIEAYSWKLSTAFFKNPSYTHLIWQTLDQMFSNMAHTSWWVTWLDVGCLSSSSSFMTTSNVGDCLYVDKCRYYSNWKTINNV